ncbi:MAG TPA: hypothetical protein VJP45_06135 [Candidatus Limnocylindria bacterium]|nr:hypothetical protein [Candidatus Limnocylindria bacterium]
MNAITKDAIERCRAGFSPSDATALAVMGKPVTPEAIRRIETIVTADLARCERERAERRAA